MGCHAFLQGIFPTQLSNPHFLYLLHWQAGSILLVPPGKPLSSAEFQANGDGDDLVTPVLYKPLEHMPVGQDDGEAEGDSGSQLPDLNPGLPSLAGDLGTMLGFSETKLHHPKTRVNK